MAYYLVKQKGDEQERLIEARTHAGARNHAAKDLFDISIAKPADLLRLGKAGVEVEQASTDTE